MTPDVRTVLTELLRLYDWRFEIAAREKDEERLRTPAYQEETARLLRQYGAEKKAAWEAARVALAGPAKPKLTALELGRILHEEFDRDGWGLVDPSYFGVTPDGLAGSEYDGLHDLVGRVARRINDEFGR